MRFLLSTALVLLTVSCSYEFMGLQTLRRGSCYSQYCTTAVQDCLMNSMITSRMLPECSRGNYQNDFFALQYCDTTWILLRCSNAQESCYTACDETYPAY